MMLTWGHTKSNDLDDGMCWEQNRFFQTRWGWYPIKFCKCKYDGVPYYWLSFGLFLIAFGQAGGWADYVED